MTSTDAVLSETAPAATAGAAPTLRDLFFSYLEISVTGFGAVLPMTRQMMVERRRWVTDEQFDEMLGPAVLMPGAMTPNIAVIFGRRTHGIAGAVVSLVALFAVPMAIVVALTVLYDRYGTIALAQALLAGIAPTAAGLLFATAGQLGAPQVRGRDWVAVAAALAAFAGVGVLRLPLPLVLVVIAPVSVYSAWRRAA